MEKTHQLPISVMIKERRLKWLGHAARRSDNNMVKQLIFATRVPGHVQPFGRPCGTCILHLCYEGCEGHGTANRLPRPRMELAERSHEHTPPPPSRCCAVLCSRWKHKLQYEEAFQRVHTARPWIHPNVGFKRQLEEWARLEWELGSIKGRAANPPNQVPTSGQQDPGPAGGDGDAEVVSGSGV